MTDKQFENKFLKQIYPGRQKPVNFKRGDLLTKEGFEKFIKRIDKKCNTEEFKEKWELN
ncbi:MAG: hypothetical protein LLF95_11615 [Bacteroidales bacterium]|nr:hypothetical protein [Bacteroidales bacterium]